MTDTTTSASAMPVSSTVSSTSSSSSPSTTASSSRLLETPVKKEATEGSLADSTSSSKKRKINNDDDEDQEDMDDDDCDESSFSSAASPSKPNHTGGRRKASDEERKARLEARQARNRLSAQYSRERKKAYVEQLEGSVNTLKAENTLLRQQREDDLVLRHALDAKLKESQLRVATLESILRTVAPSLVPLLGSSSLSSSSSSSPSSSSSAFAASSSSTLAPQFDAGLSATLASALMQNNGLVNKEVSLPLTIAAPPSTASSTLSLDTLSHQSSNEGVRLPAADVFTQFDGVAGNQSALARVGSNVDVNGSSIVNQGYPLASQISATAPEQPSSMAASAHISAPQHPVEAKAAAGVAREAEALLSNFIDLDAKFAYGDATSAPQDQGASTPAASSQPLSVGQDPAAAAAAAGASRSASASAGDFAGLSTASAGPGEGVSGSSSSSIQSSENNNIENGESTIFSTISLSKEQDPQQRFQLLNSPLMPTERNVWELATDAMLQDIYGNKDDIAADNADSSVSASDASSSEMDVLSAGSSPFDLVDLDIEIEEPMQFNIGLGDEDGCHQKADAATLDWPGLLASLVA
ncbi:uncharacterized protein SRS1_14500 [Sporisorium reilianum f. sp. reilianum]|uniref:BZIP domain-containing protein n=1 Tax=Sporisorium reilianum f. sp. reilianum TaxID=72559 RepID=A0A2N8UG99_9BASI|nr:uncharacterized protein SRS1_14500 [Sporisorium reilianum f. sp. reilianum]